MWILKDEEEVDGATFLKDMICFGGLEKNYFEILWEIQIVKKASKRFCYQFTSSYGAAEIKR